jgi:hypothetical protein
MADQIEVAAKVEAAVNQMANISSADVKAFKAADDGSIEVTLSINGAVDGDSDESDESDESASSSNSNAVEEEEDDESDDDDTSQSNSNAVEGKCGAECKNGSPCQIEAPCHVHNSGAVDGKEQTDDDDTSSSNSNAVDEEEVPHPDETDNPTKENYVVHFGECEAEDCSYGTNGEDEDFCASHSRSNAVEGSNEESGSSSNSNAVDKSYDDLSKGEKSLVTDLISDEGKSLDEAMSML